MNDEWWERPTCFICDYWWLLLMAIILGLAAFFTRGTWLPVIISPTLTPTAVATFTPLPTSTALFTSTPTVTPTPRQVPTFTPISTVALGSGDVQITLSWLSYNDLDLWVTDPAGETIFFDHASSQSGGKLDVDANPDCASLTTSPVENIFWPVDQAPHGIYTIQVNYYARCSASATAVTPYHVRVLVDGKISEYDEVINLVGDTQLIWTFER